MFIHQGFIIQQDAPKGSVSTDHSGDFLGAGASWGVAVF